ncbi:MAG: nuclear transport factor 2 family protein [Ilumatobacteraceae bacterium]|nr:nuclear transport factor 2 family protein [Ilumatobacteraceae bacterium]
MAASPEAITAAIADRLALLDIAYAYARCADRIEAEQLGALFVADGVLRIVRRGVDAPPVQRNGRAEITTAIAKLDRYEKTFHMIGNHTYDIDGDTATGEVYCIAHHVHGEPGERRDHVMMIRYQDQYRREADGWKIVVRELQVDWTEERLVTD